MRLRFMFAFVGVGLAIGCTISKSIPAERSSDRSIGTAVAEAEEMRAEQLVWMDVPAAPQWASGIRVARVHGDPTAGGDFTLRLRFPAGYVIPPHWHPKAEQVTVLSGTFVLGMGETAERSTARPYGVGDFLYMPGMMPHYGWTDGETLIQVHGTGPFTTYTVGEVATPARSGP